MLKRQTEIEHEVRRLETACPFCLQPNSVVLWFIPHDEWHPYQVRCCLCQARGPACDCGEESAVPMWLSVSSLPETKP